MYHDKRAELLELEKEYRRNQAFSVQGEEYHGDRMGTTRLIEETYIG